MNRQMLLPAGADVTADRNPFRMQPRMAGTALLGLGGLTLKSSTRRRELRREKCGYIARYAPEFFPFRALPARFGCTLAVRLNISQALGAVIYLHLVLQKAKRPLPDQKVTA